MVSDMEYKVTEEGTGSGTNLGRIFISVWLLIAVISFIVGDLLGEDSAGGMRFDFYTSHWITIQRFSTMPWSKAVADYYNPENPLFYMLASLLPLHGNLKLYHAITLVTGLLIWPLLSWAYYRRYSKFGIDWLWASFGASAILLSPTFRSSTFWGNTDWLPFTFCAATSLLLSKFQESGGGKSRAISPVTLIALAVVSSCAFYTRQYYAFLPIFTAWIIFSNTKTSWLLILGVFGLAMLPEVFLIYVWKGIVPPFHQGQNFDPALVNFWKTGAAVGLLSFPIIVGCIRRSLGDVFPRWWGVRATVLAGAGLLAFITLIIALGAPEWVNNGWGGGGGGIIIKAGVRMGAFGTPFILTTSYFGLVAIILFSMQSTTNAVLAATFLAPLFLTAPTYQRYLEPSLVVALFLFVDTEIAKAIFNKRVLLYNFIFNGIILLMGIIYYDFFLAVTTSLIPPTKPLGF
jgi:hypothetical protein